MTDYPLVGYVLGVMIICAGTAVSFASQESDTMQYDVNPFIIKLDVTVSQDSAGSMIVADVNNDGLMDFLVTAPGVLAVYHHDGRPMWLIKTDIRVGGQSESVGLPGHHGPGVQAADIDGDGATEVLFLTQDSTLHVLEGATGKEKWSATIPILQQPGVERWEHLIVATFRDANKPDHDILLQATGHAFESNRNYRLGVHLAAFALEDLKAGKTAALWSRNDYFGCAHNGARIADINGDGLDEVLGGTIISPRGEVMYELPMKQANRPHLDSVFVADVLPNRPGLEVIALEEGGENRVFCYDHNGLVWVNHYLNQEPQNAALGRFVPGEDSMQVWCRSRYNEHQKPFVFDHTGKMISTYKMDDVAPEGWTFSGVEVINKIDWTGGLLQLAAAKERHTEGDICIFNPITGEFIARFTEKAARFYVADVSGDWREEMIVFARDELHIYHNDEPNPNPDHPRLWDQQHYRRSKMTWNYYSP